MGGIELHCGYEYRSHISIPGGKAEIPLPSALHQGHADSGRIDLPRAYHADEPRTAEELAADYGLPLAAVVEAIEYGKSNPTEVAADIAREEAIMAASGQLDSEYKYHPHPRILTPEEWARLLS